MKLQLALHLPVLTILQLCHLPVSISSCLFTWCQTLYASCCMVLPYLSRYCTIRLKCFLSFLFSVCIICMKSIKKPITVQYYIASCVSWVPWLTLLDLTNKMNLGTHSWNGTHLYLGYLLYLLTYQFIKEDYKRWGFPGCSVVKNHLPMQEMWVQSLSQEDSLQKEMATHSSILAWEIPWTEEPGRRWGLKESDTT